MSIAQLKLDAEFMILNGMEPAEQVWYVPHHGIPRHIWATVTRQPAVEDFAGGAEVPMTEYTVFIVNDATKGAASIQDGKDQIHMKDKLEDLTDTVFRVVSHVSDHGAHTIRVRL